MSDCRYCGKPMQWKQYAYASRFEHEDGFARCRGSERRYAELMSQEALNA